MSTYHKKTYTGLLTNYFSFTPFKYKIGLIHTLVDRDLKINNTNSGFRKDLVKLTKTLKRNSFPSHIIDKTIKRYLDNFQPNSSSDDSISNSNNARTRYFNFNVSNIAQIKIKQLSRCFCSDLNIKLVFSSLKIKNFFSFKDPIPDAIRSSVVYQFTCAGCNSRYIGETSRHFSTRIKEHT